MQAPPLNSLKHRYREMHQQYMLFSYTESLRWQTKVLLPSTKINVISNQDFKSGFEVMVSDGIPDT